MASGRVIGRRDTNDRQTPVWTSPPVKHFAHAVFQFHRQPGQTPFDTVVILGTSGSMWDVLADSFGGAGEQSVTETVLALSDHVDLQSVSQEMLDGYSRELKDVAGLPIELLLIPAAVDLTSQKQILTSINDAIHDSGHVWLDVTHGYRHLPMLGMAGAASAVLLSKARIEDILYGALDMTQDNVTPVISLKWILEQDDFLRTAVFLAEAVEKAKQHNVAGDATQDDQLRAVRNWLAHAGKLDMRDQDRQVREWVAHRNPLRQFLKSQVQRLNQEVKSADEP